MGFTKYEALALAPKAMALPHAPRNLRVLRSEDEAREFLGQMY